jgi:hypothetical protein
LLRRFLGTLELSVWMNFQRSKAVVNALPDVLQKFYGLRQVSGQLMTVLALHEIRGKRRPRVSGILAHTGLSDGC